MIANLAYFGEQREHLERKFTSELLNPLGHIVAMVKQFALEHNRKTGNLTYIIYFEQLGLCLFSNWSHDGESVQFNTTMENLTEVNERLAKMEK
jgi:hypothetical protein